MYKSALHQILVLSILTNPIISVAQGGLFNDSLVMRTAIRTSDGGYCVRAGEWAATYLTRYDEMFTPLWSNDIRLMAGSRRTLPLGMEPGPNGSLVLVGGDWSEVFGDSPYECHHHIMVARINADGTVQDAKDYVLRTENGYQEDHIDPYSYMGQAVTCDDTGELFIALDHSYQGTSTPAIMKVDANGVFAWCVRYPGDAMIMSRILPDEAGGCFVVLYDGSAPDHFNLVHLGPDGSTIWSKMIQRSGTAFEYPFHLHRTADERLLVVGTNDRNLMRARLTLDGELEEFKLVATLPSPGQGWGISATGSAMSPDGSMTMFTGAEPPQTYRAVRADANGTVVGAWSTPPQVEGTWTTRFYPGWLQAQDTVLTTVGELAQEESVFGITISRPLVITTPLDLSGFCDLEPINFEQLALPLSQIDVSDGLLFMPVGYIETLDGEVTMTPTSADIPEDPCEFLALSAPELTAHTTLIVHPNPVISGGTLILDGMNGSEAHLIDAAGQVVKVVGLWNEAHSLKIDVAPGLYLLVVQNTDGRRRTARVVVQ